MSETGIKVAKCTDRVMVVSVRNTFALLPSINFFQQGILNKSFLFEQLLQEEEDLRSHRIKILKGGYLFQREHPIGK